MYPRITLQKGREQALVYHHPWIFSRAIAKVDPNIHHGDVVDIHSVAGDYLATGYYNGHSQIALRILQFGDQVKGGGTARTEINEAFVLAQLQKALHMRQKFIDMRQTNAFRLCFAESDGLPGLIVDVYGKFLVIQIHTLGMEKLKPLVVKALQKLFKAEGIYERSDVEVRRKEGFERENLKVLETGVLAGNEPSERVEIMENGIKYFVDTKGGQKTGFFLDQRENRQSVLRMSEGKKVLNLFSYSGGFSLAALKGGASHVTSLDISEDALALAKENFVLNGFNPDDHEFIARDVFEYLDSAIAKKEQFDVVIVDPPAFVKHKDKLAHGVQAYIKLYEKALRLCTPGGVFVASSCSSLVSTDLFRTILFKAALASQHGGRKLVMVEEKRQPVDHPLALNFPEGEYLKFALLQAE